MKKEIIEKAVTLEQAYEKDRTKFNHLFDEIKDDPYYSTLYQFWLIRLGKKKKTNLSPHFNLWNEVLFLFSLSISSLILTKLPNIFVDIDGEMFYARNIGLFLFPALAIYFGVKNKLSVEKWIYVFVLFGVSILFLNSLPDYKNSSSIIMSCIHMPLFYWSIIGMVYVKFDKKNFEDRLSYLKTNGNMVVLSAIILISGMVLTGISTGLFGSLIPGFERFYFEYVVVLGLCAAPLVAASLSKENSDIVDKIPPVIAKIFTPLVFATLLVYLMSVLILRKNPFHDREFLITFNFLLIGVMAIVVFGISGLKNSGIYQLGTKVLFAMIILTLVINLVALSAVIYRLFEYGVSPNRTAVIGGNTLMFINLIFICITFYKYLKQKSSVSIIEKTITSFLPIYTIWSIIVSFAFPIIFKFK